MIRDHRLFWSALALTALGLAFAGMSLSYPVGSAHRMGPGFFPLGLGLIVAVLGFLILLGSGVRKEDYPNIAWRPLIFISAGILAFGVFIVPLGLLPASFAAVAISSFADNTARPLPIAVYSAAIATGIYVVFVTVLGIPFTAIRGIF